MPKIANLSPDALKLIQKLEQELKVKGHDVTLVAYEGKTE